jgi:glycosyltransferase involved in cell wall biosynthesis
MDNVAVLLSTYNGAKYLKEQIKSLENQRKVKLKLFIIDDNSEDNSLEFFNFTKLPYQIYENKGYANPSKNYAKLIELVPDNFDYYCFCDQDDVWLKNKIIYSIFYIKKKNCSVLGSRTFLTDKYLNIYGTSPNFKKNKNFKNALVQSVTGGNTMIWTNKFHKIINKLELSRSVSHDWTIYQICTMLNLKFYYLKKPLVLYRQHEKNNIGSNSGIKNVLIRIFWGLKGRFKNWHNQNYKHLYSVSKKYKVSEKNLELFRNFYLARENKNPIARLYIIFFKNKIRRQTFKGNILFVIAILLNKV